MARPNAALVAATWLMVAGSVPRSAEAAAGLDCLACAQIDLQACPALERALAAPEVTAAELGAWLAKAPPDPATVRRAAAVLGLVGGDRARSALTTAAARMGPGSEVHVDLVAAAVRAGDPAARELLAGYLEAPDLRARVLALGTLAALGDPRALAPARKALAATDPRLRAAAAHVVASNGAAQDGPALLALAGADRQPQPVRIAALRGLARLKYAPAVVVASMLASHANPGIANAALAILEAVPTAWAAPVIDRALQTEGRQAAAARAAAVTGEAELGVRALQVLSATVLPLAVHRALLDAVVALKPPEASRRLLEHIAAEDDTLRVWSVQALAALGDRAAIPGLIDLLASSRGDVANYSAAALEKLSGQRLGGDVAAWQRWLGGGKEPAP